MRKFLSILLVAVLSLSVFAGCAKTGGDTETEPSKQEETTELVTEDDGSYLEVTNSVDEIDDAKEHAQELNEYAESVLEGETEAALEEIVSEELATDENEPVEDETVSEPEAPVEDEAATVEEKPAE